MFRILRETQVLCLGVLVAVAAPILCRLCGNKLELLPGIVVPICFCLGRLALLPGCPKHTFTLRQILHQALCAISLIMLFLFELGVGLFIDAKDIPLTVWAVVGSFGVAYVISICIAESIRGSWAESCVIDHNICSPYE
jgi:hypothetical protein